MNAPVGLVRMVARVWKVSTSTDAFVLPEGLKGTLSASGPDWYVAAIEAGEDSPL